MNKKAFLAVSAFSMAIAVILGALGAHALEGALDPNQLDSFKTGVRYQVWHSLALLFVLSSGSQFISERAQKSITLLFVLGIIFFSWSIYLLSCRSILGIDSMASVLGPITPMGGLLLIAGWLLLGLSFIRHKSVN